METGGESELVKEELEEYDWLLDEKDDDDDDQEEEDVLRLDDLRISPERRGRTSRYPRV